MPTNPDDFNPYCAPHESHAPAEPSAVRSVELHRPIRWFVVPVAFLYLYGGWLLIYGSTFCIMALWSLFRYDPSSSSVKGANVVMLAAMGMGIAAFGGFAVYAGYSLWKGRLLRGIAFSSLVIIGYACLTFISVFTQGTP